MKLKMAQNSVFAILLRSPWWASFLLAGAITLAVAALAPDRFKLLGAFGALPIYAVGFVAAWRQWKAPPPAAVAAQLDTLGAMTWRQFSAALSNAWVAQGAAVQPFAGLEADFCVEHAGRTVLVSARRWKAANHGAEPIEQLAAAMKKRDLTAGQYLVGHGSVSDNARALAARSGVEIVEGKALARQLLTRPT